MFLDLLYLAIGIAGLYFGAEWLVGGSSKLALRMGVTPLVIGLTVVAFGTSAPELAVSMQLNLAGEPDAAVGNVVGSNICNILLILGVSALVIPLVIDSQVVRREMPLLIAISIAFVAMLSDGEIARWEGLLLAAGIIAYVWTSLQLSKSARPETVAEFADEIGDPEEAKSAPGLLLAALVIGGLALLVAGSSFFKVGGVGIAETLGVSKAVIGLTVLAVGTSLPELATSVVACLKNEGDIIAGNAVGSCVFNLLAVVGITASIRPMTVTEIAPLDLWVMLGTAVLGVLLMLTRRRLGRIEGTVLLVAYVAYLTAVVMRGGVPAA